jgi:hypothetical protein
VSLLEIELRASRTTDPEMNLRSQRWNTSLLTQAVVLLFTGAPAQRFGASAAWVNTTPVY